MIWPIVLLSTVVSVCDGRIYSRSGFFNVNIDELDLYRDERGDLVHVPCPSTNHSVFILNARPRTCDIPRASFVLVGRCSSESDFVTVRVKMPECATKYLLTRSTLNVTDCTGFRVTNDKEPIDSGIEHAGSEGNEGNGEPAEVRSSVTTPISTTSTQTAITFSSTSTTAKTTLPIVRDIESANSTLSTTVTPSTTTTSSTNSMSDLPPGLSTADDAKTNAEIKWKQEVEGDSSIMEADRTIDIVQEKKVKTIDTTDESKGEKKKIDTIDTQRSRIILFMVLFPIVTFIVNILKWHHSSESPLPHFYS